VASPIHQLRQLLEACTVRLYSPDQTLSGTGFFAAPGCIVTCAHVLGPGASKGARLCFKLDGEALTAEVATLDPNPCPRENIYPDIAVLIFPERKHQCVYLTTDYEGGDPVYSWGYSDLRRGGESIRGQCDGDGVYEGGTPAHRLIKFKEGQVRPGISGSPLLNERTGGVCGIIKRTRGADSDLGGLAVRTQVLLPYLQDFVPKARAYHECNPEWLDLVRAVSAASEDPVEISFQRYQRAVEEFSYSSYRELPLPDDVKLDEVFINPRVRAVEIPGLSGVFPIDQLFRLIAASPMGPHLLIEGQPGTGKTTLLRYIASHAFGNPELVGLSGRRIPMMVRLQSLAKASGMSTEDQLIAAVNDAKDVVLDIRPPVGFFDQWPVRNKAKWLLLLDGFDEVPTERRAGLRRILRKLMSSDNQIVITARPGSLERSFLGDLNRFELELFNSDQQRNFAVRWFRESADYFLKAVFETGGEFLARTPLLLTIAAIVFRSTNKLPSRRTDLYGEFVTVWWREALDRGLADELGSELRDLSNNALQHLARDMTEDRENISFTFLAKDLARFLAEQSSRPLTITQPWSERLLEVLGRRSGIFAVRAGNCEWLHPTFREYLCAKDLSSVAPESPEALSLAKKWKEDQWRQVLVFLFSIWSEGSSVLPLLKRIANLSKPYGLVFCADAIAAGTNSDENFEKELVKRLCQVAMENSEGTICNRLLAGLTDDSTQRAEEVLRVLAQMKSKPVAVKDIGLLIGVMVERAQQWKEQMGNAAVNDLALLGCTSELLAISKDKSVFEWVRLSAAEDVGKLGAPSDAIDVLSSLANGDFPSNVLIRALDHLGELRAGDVLLSFARKSSTPTELRLHVVEILDKGAMLNELKTIADDELFDSETRHRALVGLLGKSDVSEAQSLIRRLLVDATPSGSVIREIIDTLRRMEHWDALSSILLCPSLSSDVYEYCIKTLEQNKKIESILSLLDDPRVSEEMKWSAAKSAREAGTAEETNEALFAYYEKRLVVEDLDVLRERSKLFISLGRHSDAIPDLDRIIAKDPTDEWSLALRANSHRLTGNPQAAVSDFGRALSIDADDVWDLVRRGYAYHDLGSWERAIEDFSKAEALGSSDHFYEEYSDCYLNLGRHADASRLVEHAIDLDVTSDMAYGIRAEIHASSADWNQALADLEQAIILSPRYKFALGLRGNTHRCMGAIRAAFDDFSVLLGVDESRRSARSARCELAIRLNDWETARQDLDLYAYQNQSSSWLLYLGWLLDNATGHGMPFKTELALARLEAERKASPAETRHKANQALYELATGNLTVAQAIYRELLDDRQYDHLRRITVPELEDFVVVLNRYREQLDPLICLLREASEKNMQNLCAPTVGSMDGGEQKEEGPACPHPFYCPSTFIAGLEAERARAEQLLTGHARARNAVVIWQLKGAWLYGQCNFKYKKDHPHDLKFVNTKEQIIRRDARLLRGAGARKFLFVDQGLLNDFEASTSGDLDSYLDSDCMLIEDGLEGQA
jgi:tetratricopeptide (TPR) repeat protein